jgi:poly-gamma-glutamate capsule biosynthesis protein CapA/YwtB (metallophosphatase superfamily)
MEGSIKIKLFFIVLISFLAFLFIPNFSSLDKSIVSDYFLDSKLYEPTQPEEPRATVLAAGDTSYSRGVDWIISLKKDINYPFEKVSPYFKKADLVWLNMETPITPGERIPDGVMRFRSNPEMADAFVNAGVTMVNLANNHTPDFGTEGLLDTFKYLEAKGIGYVGAGINEQSAYAPVYKDVNGIKIAFLAYTEGGLVPALYEAGESHPGTAYLNIDKLKEGIGTARKQADIVIVGMHSGIEYVRTPTDWQKEFARTAIDEGADIVIGHHPHVVQSAEIYKGKYIFYSLGNFIFDQHFSKETREGIMLGLTLNKNGVEKILVYPYYMEAFAQPAVRKNDDSQYWENILKLNFNETLKLYID